MKAAELEKAKQIAEQKKAEEAKAQQASNQSSTQGGDATQETTATPSSTQTQTTQQAQPVETSAPAQTGSVSGGQFQSMGVINTGGLRYTYYNLNMSGVEAMHGTTFHDRGDGVLVDPSGYVVVAYGMSGYGQIISTPLGQGKVYDHCPTANTVDVAVVF